MRPAVSRLIGKLFWRPTRNRASWAAPSVFLRGEGSTRLWRSPYFDAAKISVPTLVIRGDADTSATREDNQQLIAALGATAKEYVEIPNGGHFLQFENVNMEFYQALQNFLEAED